MNVLGRWPGGAVRRAGCALAGAALVLAGLAGAAPAAGSGTVLARLGPITVSATAAWALAATLMNGSKLPLWWR